MIKFTKNDDNKQFIAIGIKDSTPTTVIIKNLQNTYTVLQRANFISDNSEICVEIDNNTCYGFSLEN